MKLEYRFYTKLDDARYARGVKAKNQYRNFDFDYIAYYFT